jgi:hypothetical protein
MNMSHAASARNSDTVFYSSTDNYIRKTTAAGMRSSLGLTNSATTTATSADTINTVAMRDGSGDINVRLCRSDYQNQTTCTGALAFRTSTSDNYIRFCSDAAAIRTFIGCLASNGTAATATKVQVSRDDTGDLANYLVFAPTATAGQHNLQMDSGLIYDNTNNRLRLKQVMFGDQNVYGLGAVAGDYGSVGTVGTGKGSYEGYNINGHWGFISNAASSCGIMNDSNNEWAAKFNQNASTDLYYNNSNKFQTTNTGAHVTGSLYADHMYIDDYLYHNGDDNTRIGFGSDTIYMRTGGTDRLTISNAGSVDLQAGLYIPHYIYHVGDNNTYFGFSGNDTIVMRTAGTNRLTVTSNGNIGIGTTTASHNLEVYGSVKLGTNNGATYIGGNLGGVFMRMNDDMWFSDPQNSTIAIRNVSDTGAGTMVGNFNPASSITLKKDVEVLGDDDLNRFYTDTMETDLHSYYYKNEVEGEDKKRVGIILERAPEYFAGTRDGKSLNMTHWNTMLHGACKVIDKNVKTVMNDMKNHLDFTGQHRTFISNIPLSEYEKYEGLIVSADMNEYYNDSIEINEALPIVSLCKKSMDKACFGVISTKEDPNNYEYNAYITREDGDIRAKINSIGEGAIWVINVNGNLESGDYITTSNCAVGYGQKQDDDILHNYTVAKITMDCDFNNSSKKKKQIKKEVAAVTYYVKDEESIVDEYVYDTWDSTKRQIKEIECYTKEVISSYSEPKEGGWVEYESNSGSKSMNEEEYTSATPEEKATYKPVYNKKITKTLSTLDYNMTKIQEIKNGYQKNKHTFHFITVHKETKTPTDGYESEIRQELVNVLDEHGQIQWEDVLTETEKAYKLRYLDANGVITDEANAVHTAAFVGCTYHCG